MDVNSFLDNLDRPDICYELLDKWRNNLDLDLLNEVLQVACFNEKPKIATLLIAFGANLHENDLILQCCKRGLSKIVKYLVGRGCNVNQTCKNDKNCGHYAYLNGHKDLGNWLIYKTNLKCCQRDHKNRTVLDCRKLGLAENKYQFDEEENENDIFVLNSKDKIACGSGLKGIKWLQRKRTKV